MESATVSLDHEAAILSRAIGPSHGNWPSGIAQAVLSIGLSPADRSRMDTLAEKARDGSLTHDEEIEIEGYRHVCRLIEWMKAKARASLKAATPRS